MKKGRCLGLIGGLGVGASVHYYENLAKAHDARTVSLDFVMVHAEAPRALEYVQAGDREGLAGYLTSFICRLQAAGAEFAFIPAVTPHFCIRELIGKSPLPVIDIIQPLKEELSTRAITRVALFGTRFVMQSELFGMVPALNSFVHARTRRTLSTKLT